MSSIFTLYGGEGVIKKLLLIVKSKSGFGVVEIMVVLLILIFLVIVFKNHIITMLTIIFSQI